jgi:hypothetical protein
VTSLAKLQGLKFLDFYTISDFLVKLLGFSQILATHPSQNAADHDKQ